MNTYTDKLPPLWWLRPWHHARRLHAAVIAINSIHQHNLEELNRLRTSSKAADAGSIRSASVVYKAYQDVAEENYRLQQKLNDLEAKWPRDLWHGGKIYGDVYTCVPGSETHDKIAKVKRSTRKPAKKKGRRRA